MCALNNSFREIFKITSQDVIYFGTPLTFDPSVIELFLALTTGAKLLIVPQKIHINPKKLLSILFPQDNKENAVSFLQMPPSVFLRWSSEEIEYIFQKSSLKVLALGGEVFPSNILKIPKGNVRIFNLYGITEVSCWASVLEFTNCEDNIYLGKCLTDTVFEVRDEKNSVVYQGKGELFIGKHLYCTYFSYLNLQMFNNFF